MAGCPSGQWERTVNPSRKLRRFEPCTCHVKIPNCFKCDKELPNIMTSIETDAGLGYVECENINQPTGGLAFMTHGHYGSSEFDSMSPDRWLEINLCDECVANHRSKVLHVVKLPHGFTTPVMMETWNPYKHGN